MLRPIRVVLGGMLGTWFLTAAIMSQAAQPAERELLGVRIWRDYATVLRVHGEPTRVVPGMALPPEMGVGSINVNMQRAQTGGMSMGIPGGPMMGAPMGMAGPPGAPMMGGMMSAGGMSAPMMGGMGNPRMGAMGNPRMMGGMSAPMGGGGRSMPTVGGMAGGPPMPGGMGGARGKSEDEDDIGAGSPIGGGARGAMRGPMGGAGVPGPGGMMMPPMYGGGTGLTSAAAGDTGLMAGLAGGPMGMPGIGGMRGSVGAQSQVQASVPSEEVKETWVYVRGQQTIHFMFNKDGRVIRIQSFGPKGKGATSRSITLGDPVAKVYQKYGWAGTTIRQGDSLTLDYSQKFHVVFDLLDRHDGKGMRVVGITIAPSEGRR